MHLRSIKAKETFSVISDAYLIYFCNDILLRLGLMFLISGLRYSLTEEGREAVENLERYRDCVSPSGNIGRTSTTSIKYRAT